MVYAASAVAGDTKKGVAMFNTITDIKTSPQLLRALEEAKHRVVTPAERFDQKVSYVHSMLGKNNKLTPDQVRRMLIDEQTVPAESGR